ncbi:hypothetical protein, partial [Pseudomonas viridiflava]|uniref:hypothetical protein n=1 Tax=Pseudomonas viridiflava TaxID=33069 RepID=UPI00197E3877
MLFLKRPISDLTDAIAGKPPPTGMHSVRHFRFAPRFARLADLCITMSAGQSGDELLTTAMLPWLS